MFFAYIQPEGSTRYENETEENGINILKEFNRIQSIVGYILCIA